MISRLLFTAAFSASCALAFAQTTVDVATPGTLSSLISADEKYTITDLTVTGTLNGDDIAFLRDMAGKDSDDEDTEGSLTSLNLSGIELTDGGGAYYQDSWAAYYTATSYDVSDDEDVYYCTDLSYAFTETKLTKVVWPDTMWEVGEHALSYTDLQSFVLGTETNEIKDYAFYKCSSLSDFSLTDKILYIDDHAFDGCSALKTISIPLYVEEIAPYAFNNCSGLESVDFSSCDVTSIGKYAFSGCESLGNLTLPESLKTLGDAAFEDCSGMSEITLPKNLKTLGQGVFEGCTSLNAINVAKGNKYLSSVDGMLFNYAQTKLYVCPVGKSGAVVLPETTEEISASAFSRCSLITSLTLPESLTTIGDEAFYRCTSLTTLAIPDAVTSIGENAFYRCKGLKTVTLGSGLTKIGDSAFYYCNGLEYITVPETVTAIGYAAFYGCSALRAIELSATITEIESDAFGGCSSLECFAIKVADPLTVDSSVFDDVDKTSCGLYVPSASIDKYKTAAVWKEFTHIDNLEAASVNDVELEDCNVAVENGCVTICGNVTDVRIFSVTGQLVYAGNETHIRLPQHGIFIVSVNGKPFKVMY